MDKEGIEPETLPYKDIKDERQLVVWLRSNGRWESRG